jgi:cytochrome c biogenesis protein CcmG/thiol:disulfide interchange protein DsbE
MRPNISAPAPVSNRLPALITVLLILGAAWTFQSRVPVSSSQRLVSPASPKEGFAAPDFALDLLDGGQLTLSELRGHPVILNLWASWCLPCRKEMPAIERVFQRYQDAGLIVVGLNMTSEDSTSDVSAFVQEFGLTFPIALDRDGLARERYQLLGLPSTYFIDESGIIRSVVVGGPMGEATIRSKVEDLLGVK